MKGGPRTLHKYEHMACLSNACYWVIGTSASVLGATVQIVVGKVSSLHVCLGSVPSGAHRSVWYHGQMLKAVCWTSLPGGVDPPAAVSLGPIRPQALAYLSHL